jgi:hypothetical protein
LGALKLPEICCAVVVCGADALDAPGELESGDPARCAAVCAEAAADAGEAAFVALEAAAGVVPVPDVLEAPPESVVSVLLMSISCSRLFTCTSWSMYALGSVSEVGSWFCISVTSNVRKSLAEMVAELSLESLLPLVLLVLLVPDVALAKGVAALGVSACPAVIW